MQPESELVVITATAGARRAESRAVGVASPGPPTTATGMAIWREVTLNQSSALLDSVGEFVGTQATGPK